MIAIFIIFVLKISLFQQLSFCNCPIQTHERSSRKTVYIAHDFSSGTLTQIIEMVDELLENWIAICKLYDVVSTFSSSFTAVAGIVEIKSFSYKKLGKFNKSTKEMH